jgi:hypothetical protein
MSFSNPRAVNPVSKFIKFNGASGKFDYWDKSKGENGESVEMPIERIGFIVLDELNTMTGFNERAKAGIYSNEVSDLRSEELNVRVFKTDISIAGLYENIKDKAKGIGAKFTKSVYGALVTGKDSLELVNFQLSGSAFGGWMDKKVDVSKQGVRVMGLADGEKGAIKYKIPVFVGFEISDSLRAKAIEMDKELQEFLKQYRSKQVEEKEAHSYKAELPPTINAEDATNITVDDVLGQGSAEKRESGQVDDTEDLPF